MAEGFSEVKKSKANYWKVIAITLIILIWGVGAYFGYNYLSQKAYNQGRVDGSNQVNLELLYRINTEFEIPLLVNETYFEWVGLDDLFNNFQNGNCKEITCPNAYHNGVMNLNICYECGGAGE